MADYGALSQSLVSRAEKGEDLRFSTWERLFAILGLRIIVSVEEIPGAEESEDDLLHETGRRHEKRVEFLNRRLY